MKNPLAVLQKLATTPIDSNGMDKAVEIVIDSIAQIAMEGHLTDVDIAYKVMEALQKIRFTEVTYSEQTEYLDTLFPELEMLIQKNPILCIYNTLWFSTYDALRLVIEHCDSMLLIENSNMEYFTALRKCCETLL